MAWTPAQHEEALAALRSGNATNEQRRKVEEAGQSGDPNRGRAADARRAIEEADRKR